MDYVEAFAQQSRFDLVSFVFSGIDADERQRHYQAILDSMQSILGGDPARFTKFIKVQIFPRTKVRNQEMTKITVSGYIAAACTNLPIAYAHRLTEAHVKSYVVEREGPGGMAQFTDAMYNGTSNLQLSFFNNPETKRTKKGSGSRGGRVGSRKADVQTVWYARRGERYGVEGRVKGRILRTLVQRELPGIQVEYRKDADRWYKLRLAIARHAARRFSRHCEGMGVDITEYVEGFTTYEASHMKLMPYSYTSTREEDYQAQLSLSIDTEL